MTKFISKSIYIEYLKCSKNAWLKFNKAQELKSYFEYSEEERLRFKQGNEVDALVQEKFLGGVSLYEDQERMSNQTLALRTQKYIEQLSKEKLRMVLFQPTFIFDKFLARNDILVYEQESDTWHLYEVKACNSFEEASDKIDYIEDASFQVIVLQENGLKISKIFITHLNGEYINQEGLDINSLFKDIEITAEVRKREHNTRQKMQDAKIDLFLDDELALVCKCIYLGRSRHCKTFGYSHGYVPAYSIHDITRIGSSKKKLAELVDRKIFDITNIPKDFKLSDTQKNQVIVYKSQKSIVDSESIKVELKKLEYPLYFLDYESYSAPIPPFEGFRPYQQIPFQFSLSILTDVDSEPMHIEYLHELNSDPSQIIIQRLISAIGKSGTVIAWHKGFEQRIHSELGERHPEYKEFFQDLNNRFFDLEEIFKNQYYIDAEFKGKTSIKYVLPAFFPAYSYKNLAIQNGETAFVKWFDMISDTITTDIEKNKIANDLREYCYRDTYAMYKIWKFLDALE